MARNRRGPRQRRPPARLIDSQSEEGQQIFRNMVEGLRRSGVKIIELREGHDDPHPASTPTQPAGVNFARDSDSNEVQSCMTTAQSRDFNNPATGTSQPLFESKSSTRSAQQTSQPKPIDAKHWTTNPPRGPRATSGSNASNASANQASQKFGSFGRNRSDGFANQTSQEPSDPWMNNRTFAPPPPFAARPGRNASSSSWLNVPVQPQPTKNASANSPTCASGQASPVPTLFGRVGAQKPQTGPENPAKTQITPSTFGKRQADDQSSTSDPSQNALHPKKLLKREPSDESRINQAKTNSTPATNANPPDFVFSSSWTGTKEVQSFGSKINELQEGIKQRDRTILRRRELNAWREERRQKLSARRAICQNELKESYDKLKKVYDKLDKIQKEEEDLEEHFREKTSLKKMEKAHENSA